MEVSPRALRLIATGVVALFAVWYLTSNREKSIPVGEVIPNLISAPMSPAEAASVIATTNAHAKVSDRNGELVVQVDAATLPQRREGQLALAQQYARADEIVLGRKRAISFLEADGSPFAKADPARGVMMTR